MIIEAEAITNFAYFTCNFPHDFIEKCWEDNNHIIKHLESKLKGKVKNGMISSRGFISFFLDLDRANQYKLANWINKNYKGI